MLAPTFTFLSAGILSLLAFTPSAAGAAIEKRDYDWNNQVNYYSDPRCKQYAGTWPGADHMYSNKNIDVGGIFIGSVILLPGDANNFDSLDADGKEVVSGNGMCPSDANGPILRDANGNYCYVVGKNVNKIELYTQECAVIPSE